MDRQIPLTNSDGFALVSDEDYERVTAFNWRLFTQGYVVTGSIENRPNKTERNDFIMLHRFVMRLPQARHPVVDHINRMPHDCRRENLRIVSQVENLRNSFGYKDYAPKGVTRLPSGRWRAMVRHYGKLIHLGVYTTIEEANAARVAWEIKNWKEGLDA